MTKLHLQRSDVRMNGTRDNMLATLGKYGLSFDTPRLPGSMLVAHCSATKGKDLDVAVPKQFYVSPRNLRFYAACEAMGEQYGILSDQYGLHMHDEPKPFYDIHPSTVTAQRLWALGDMIEEVCKRRGVTALHYVVAPPSTAVPYLLMLFASGIPFSMSTKIKA